MDLWQLTSRRMVPESVVGVHHDDGVSVISWLGCALMGVVNTTPDSFSDGGRYLGTDAAVEHARQLATEGALIVDIGGESTRPGADVVPLEVELERTIPVIRAIADDGRVVISVDTRKAAVAEAAIAAGAHIVNDVSGLRDPAMVAVCAAAGVPVVIMHMQGTPADMQRNPHYDDVVGEVTDWLLAQAAMAIGAGVPSVMLDPGIGFGKTLDHNVALFRALPLTSAHPVLIGASRKRTIQQLADLRPDEDRGPGSVAAHVYAAHRGAAMVRVHDVAAHRQAFAVDAGLRQS